MRVGHLTEKIASFLKMSEKGAPPVSGDMKRAFHGDRCYQKLILSICSQLPISSFVETGTHFGDTTEYMANAIAVPIVTCELKESYFHSSAERLKQYKNVKVIQASSEQVIRQAIDQNLLGPLPFFYLDAHWYDYWPLLDELEVITSRVSRCIVVIDDFQVPGCPEYVFCEGGGGSAEFSGRTTVDNRTCNLDLIQDKLNYPAKYELLYPRYSREEAFGPSDSETLIGYVAMFKNLELECKSLMQQQFIKDHFTNISIS
jgi:hypothetical protein